MPGAERRHRKKALKPAIKRELVSYLTTQFTMSIRQACRTLSLSRTVFRYQPGTRRDEPVVQSLTERSEEHTSELQSHRDLHSFPTRRSSDLNEHTPGMQDIIAEQDGVSLSTGYAT